MTKYLKEYRDFAGGLNVDTAPEVMADNELLVAENVDLGYVGAVRKREGFVTFNATSYSGEVERLIEWPRNDGTKVLLAVITIANTPKLYRVAEDGTLTEICALNKADIGWFTFQDKFYFLDGAQYRVYDGSSVSVVYRDGDYNFTATSSADTGSWTYGYHYVAVSYVFQDGSESALGSKQQVLLGSSYTLNINFLPVPSGRDITKRRIYVTLAGQTSPFYRCMETYIVGSGNVSDGGVNDTTLATYPQHSASPIPKISNCNKVCYHPQSGRIFVSGNPSDPSAVYFSLPNLPSEFGINSILYPSTGDGNVQGLGIFGRSMLALYSMCIWAWTGIDPASDATWYKLPVPIGALSQRVIAYIPNAMSFVGRGGIYALSPSTLMDNMVLQVGSSYVTNIANGKVVSFLSSITPIAAVYDYTRNRYMLSYRDTHGNYGILVCWNLSRYAVWKGIRVNDFCLRSNGDLLIASTNYILKLGGSYADVDTSSGASVGVTAKITTKPLMLDSGFRAKKVERVFLDVGAVANGTLDLTVTSEEGTVSHTDIETSAGGSYELSCMLKGNTFSVTISDDSNNMLDLRSVGFRYKPLHPTGKRSDA